jgi:phosphoribosylanthranilate isomerase
MRVKICGLRTHDDVAAAVEAGADALGFVLVPSPRRVSVREAARLAARVPSSVARVAVVRVLSAESATDALAAGCTHLQAIGAAHDFGSLPSGLAPLPVVLEGAEAEVRFDSLTRLGTPILFDGARQGSGACADSALASRLAARHPLVLAGGLSPASVADAIARVRPVGVDVSSGVERAPGLKSASLVHAFVRAARAALDTLGPRAASIASPLSSNAGVSRSDSPLAPEESSCR